MYKTAFASEDELKARIEEAQSRIELIQAYLAGQGSSRGAMLARGDLLAAYYHVRRSTLDCVKGDALNMSAKERGYYMKRMRLPTKASNLKDDHFALFGEFSTFALAPSLRKLHDLIAASVPAPVVHKRKTFWFMSAT